MSIESAKEKWNGIKHTPGPWRVEKSKYGLSDYLIRDTDDMEVCSFCISSEEDRPLTEANATLISAAPDLLAACEWAVRVIGAYLDGGTCAGNYDPYNCLNDIITAIAKAKGENQ